jgi:hypothetical protein
MDCAHTRRIPLSRLAPWTFWLGCWTAESPPLWIQWSGYASPNLIFLVTGLSLLGKWPGCRFPLESVGLGYRPDASSLAFRQ